MWRGIYNKLHPIPGYSGMPFEIEAVHDDWEGFRVWFKHHDPTKAMLIAKFDDELFYSSSDEGDRLAGVQNDISKEFPHLFWEVSESALITEFKRQCSRVRDQDDLHHYCFMSCNQAVDVISLSAPLYVGHDI